MCLGMTACSFTDNLEAKGLWSYKVDTSECNYNNGIYAFKYDTEKLEVSDVMDLGTGYISVVDIISDKAITGDSNLVFLFEKGAKNTEDSISEFLKEKVDSNFNVKSSTNMQKSVYKEKNYVVAEYTFETDTSKFMSKAFSKWGNTLIVTLELKKEDSGNNAAFEELYNSVQYIGVNLDSAYMSEY